MIIARKTHSTANPRGKARALEHRDERVQQQRHERGDDEDQRHGTGRPHDQECADYRQWQYDRLDPARHYRRIDRCGRGMRLRGGRIAGLGLERRVLHSAGADVVLALLHARSMRTRADGALASVA